VARLALLAALALLGTSPAAAAAKPKVKRVLPAAAVPGAAIEVKGTDLKRAKVTVAGKKAEVLGSTKKKLRVVVPAAKPGKRKLVVRKGRRKASAVLRILKRFDGTANFRLEKSQAKTAGIGPAGGAVSVEGADGTRYELTVPAGALASERQISVTPVKSFSGLPFSGRARGASLQPSGLTFAEPATLTITVKKALPKGTVGFSTASDGGALEVQALGAGRRTLKIRIDHFSSGGVVPTNPADFANAVAPLLVQQPMQEAAIRSMIDLIATYEVAFSPFCPIQPACGDAIAQALSSLDTTIATRCADTTPFGRTLRAASGILRLQAMRQQLDATDDPSRTCRERILTDVLTAAKAATCDQGADPLAARNVLEIDDLRHWFAGQQQATLDLDGDGDFTNLEFMYAMVGVLSTEGLQTAELTARTCADNAIAGIPAHARSICGANLAGALRRLQTGIAYGVALEDSSFPAQAYNDAFDFCRLAVAVDPTAAALQPGGTQQFSAVVSNLVNPAVNKGVTWTASGGTVSSTGFYTAPSQPGTYTVTATSTHNPARKSSAQVTVVAETIRIDGGGGSAGAAGELSCLNASPEEWGDSDASANANFSISKGGQGEIPAADCAHGLQKASGSGSATGSASVTSTGATLSVSGQGSMQGEGHERNFNIAGMSADGAITFTVLSGSVAYTLTSSHQANDGAGSQAESYAGMDGLPSSGTLPPGTYTLGAGVSCHGFMSTTTSTIDEVDFSCDGSASATVVLTF